mmetsp:Transcript_39604/g.35369  ORF Transcript_39604/g.35369 Transcript_39604/m.35369 type:complete len:108 (-) Transcript_39604:312-635(-)
MPRLKRIRKLTISAKELEKSGIKPKMLRKNIVKPSFQHLNSINFEFSNDVEVLKMQEIMGELLIKAKRITEMNVFFSKRKNLENPKILINLTKFLPYLGENLQKFGI